MNTTELITELLHGELTDDRSVAELMHILSVSPEKRAAFLEHIRMSRQVLRSGRDITPPPSATQGVWARIAAAEPGLAIGLPLATVPTVRSSGGRAPDRRRWGVLLLVLLAGIGGGTFLGYGITGAGRSSEPDIAVAQVPPGGTQRGSTASNESLQGTEAREEIDGRSVDEERKSMEANPIAAQVNSLRDRIAVLGELLDRERKTNVELRAQIDVLLRAARETTAPFDADAPATEQRPAFFTMSLHESRARSLPFIAPDDGLRNASESAATSAVSERTLDRPAPVAFRDSGPWRIEMRQHLRSSLPEVIGLGSSSGVFSDREIGAGFEFTALQRAMRLGVAVGGTSFSQVYHTNTGGALNDTIVEQSPSLIYGRAYVAQRLFAADRFSGSLELGAGGTEIGPIGTAGLNLEYSAADRVTVIAGLSSWLLWTSYRNQLHASTNLNAHVGISLNP